jgi:hypothetical protein
MKRLRGLARRHPAGFAFTALAGLAVLRSPYILFSGRFWAEEATVYFPALLGRGWRGLFFVYQHVGYLHLFANVGVWLATLVPLEVAPLVTAWFSLALILLLLWIALSWPSVLLPSGGTRLAAAALLLLGATAEPEVWLNTINAQTYLGIVAVLILFLDFEAMSRRQSGISLATLAVAGLSGLYACALAPLFVIRAWRERNRRTFAHAGVIAIAVLVQVVAIAASAESGTVSEARLVWPTVGKMARTIAGAHIDSAVLGRILSEYLSRLAESGQIAATVFLGLIAIVVVIAIGTMLARSRPVWVPTMLLTAFALTELLIQLGALDVAGGRYSVVPVAIVTLAAVHGISLLEDRHLRWAALGIGAVVLTIGLIEFWTDVPWALSCNGCPDWSAEVAQWRIDPGRALSIWPYPSWTTHLP